ncbi:MAG: hypothetical protein GOP50_01040 [Candidatus Heimdallarchaeota archaeon]|nr:hypothetical protein [Candidatus Heimdallarchaeota archaeon]
MTEETKILKPPAGIKLSSLSDLIKLVISGLGPDRNAGYIGRHSYNDKTIYFIFNTSLGYYELNALPIIVWVEDESNSRESFLRYRTSPKEEHNFSNDASDAKWLNIPLVTFEEMPDFLKVWKK